MGLRQKTKWKLIQWMIWLLAISVGGIGYYLFEYTNTEPIYILILLAIVFVGIVAYDFSS